jgi:hypothetical protein
MANVNSSEMETMMYLLKDFLSEQRKLHARGITLETLYNRVGEVQEKQNDIRGVINTLATDQIGLNMRLDRYGNRLRKLEKGAAKHHGDDDGDHSEDSGVIRIEEMKRAQELANLKQRVDAAQEELHREREMKNSNITFWERQRWLWVGLVFMAVFTALMSGCTGLIVWKITQSQNQGTK